MIGLNRWRPILILALVPAIVFLLALPALPLAAAAPAARPTEARPAVGPGFSANVYWNGANVAGAGSTSSAITLSSYTQVTVRYFWNYTDSPPGFSLTDARLAMTYFGFALATRDVPPIQGATASSGSFDMNWSVGAIEYVLAGTYKLTATLFSANGSTVWSESFFVHLVPPYSIGAIVPILLILIVIVEAIAVARSGRQAALRSTPSKAPPPPPASPPPSAPPSPPSSSAAAPVPPPSTPPPPPPEPSTPPGGSS